MTRPVLRMFLASVLALLPARIPAQIAQSEYAARRDSLAARLGDGVIIVLGAHEPAEDFLSFFQSSSFLYLTGFREPESVLVLVRQGGRQSSTLFVQPREPAREVWTGARLGAAGVAGLTGMQGRSIDELDAALDSLARSAQPFFVIGDLGGGTAPATPDAQFVQRLRERHPGLTLGAGAEPAERVLRGSKSPAELALIRRAVDITVGAQRDAMRAMKSVRNEFEIQALVEYDFRRNGAERPSFSTIIGSGPNSTTLHYNADDRPLSPGDVVVIDIGAQYDGYAADVTRTVPVGGTFSPEQRAIYQIVRDAQAAAERQATLGAPARAMSDSARAVLAEGLARLGLIESPSATYDGASGQCREPGGCPQLSLYYMHGLGHGIGLDVHDPDQFNVTGKIAPGSAFTIEPGIYVRANVLATLTDTPRNRATIAKLSAAVRRYANIGIRIEDDYIATPAGVEWISRAPREMGEIEAAMREPWMAPGTVGSARPRPHRDQ
ncbi:MAG: Xaa-Pro aminopeptidase [Gemmatimonadota bacterium]|nr:Xaa-Pro aminopeptidase [Gemmatimonadota bacterium]